MARFTSIGMGRKKFVQSAAEEAQQSTEGGASEDGPSTHGEGQASGIEKKKKKRRGRERVKDETGKRVAIGEKKGPDAKKSSWGKDEGISRRAKLSAKHAEERKQRRNEQKNANVTCFACRGVGHASKDCPNVLLGAGAEPGESGMKRKGGKAGSQVTGGGKCYRCNSNEHSLHDCPEPIDSSNPTPYATCYICLGTGHLSSGCPSNGGKGIYVNGGSCKVCKSVEHRAKDCPDDPRRQASEQTGEDVPRKRGEIVLGVGQGAGADEDDFMVESRENLAKAGDNERGKRKKHLPARNSERPMKRLREVDPVTGDLGERLPGGYEGPPEGQREGQQEGEKIPLTARRVISQQPKAKGKVVSF
ncbi:hypothetical protein I302_104914 [Kwoniella bestiolae CBS 10118]|uniref:CCHC-type domain-containing protein n=1 Tax=Kwoniella bestiolae CBS 10118 TaxID=1296100 RepID=A0A1B9FRE4_9TREE|nr:hypothetical protein I302_09015 [Kwoniella bestiolae CBS 10118]OCF21341.1 hypothetical protein I302_09015 [Kwoniella bestiolae CBS 10118]